jgi:hypothetical protein
LEKHNGGRMPIVNMDLGTKPSRTLNSNKIEMPTPQEDTTLQALEATREGLQNDKEKTQHPTIIPTNLLPTHKRPQHYKPNIIRAIGYTRNTQGQLLEDTTYKGRRCLQIIECKYSTYTNTLDNITNIHNIYEPLKQVIMRHTRKKRLVVQIIPIVISRGTRLLHTIGEMMCLAHPFCKGYISYHFISFRNKQNGQLPHENISRDSSTSILQGKSTKQYNI